MDWTVDATWTATRRALAAATGLAPAAYTSADCFDDEQARVFGRAWVCVGLVEEVAAPGRLLVRSVGGRSIIVTRSVAGASDDTPVRTTGTRGPIGELRAFLNACRHRGTELAEADCDIGSTIRCPYHRWGYATDGRLIATPRFDEVPREIDRADLGLVPVRVDTWGPLLFVCLRDDTPDLRTWLGDLPERMAGYRLERWTEHENRTIDINANWKLVSENFQEYYHLAWVHPELAKVSRVEDHYRYQGPGMYCGQTTTPVSGDDRDDWLRLPAASGLDASDTDSGRFVAIFPNVLLSVLPNHAFVVRLEPAAPGRTVETCSWLLPPGSATAGVTDESGVTDASDASDLAPTVDFWCDVNREDIDIVERGQRGLLHGAVPAGPLAPRFEEPLHRFHNMLADCMTLDSLADLAIPEGDDLADPASRLGTRENPRPPAIDA